MQEGSPDGRAGQAFQGAGESQGEMQGFSAEGREPAQGSRENSLTPGFPVGGDSFGGGMMQEGGGTSFQGGDMQGSPQGEGGPGPR